MKLAKTSGFTLIELLVVISIILIASSIIFIGGSGGSGAALSSSERIVSGIAQGARGQAILKNADTRLIIHNDPADLDKYRRFFGIVYRVVDSNGVEGWLAATQGTYLPSGIYFDAASSSTSHNPQSNWSTANPMRIDFPRNVAQPDGSGDTEFLYYRFNSNGTSNDVNAWLVLRAGTMIPVDSSATLSVSEDQELLRTALIFRRAGTTTSVNNPDSIPVASANSID